MTICSTLSGKVAIKHPTLGVLVREDGAVFNKKYSNKYNHEHHWTFGSPQGKYLHVKIKGKSYSVHRLVAEAFLPNPENKPTVDHINRITTDNRVSNLRWATAKEQAENSSQYEKGINGIFNRDDHNAYNREKYHTNLEHCRETVRKCRASNPELYREISRRSAKKRRQENGDAIRKRDREYMRKYRAAKKQQKAAQ